MVNTDFNPAFILGIALILCGVALYGMRSMRPELSRDHDIFFAAIALVSGLILMFQGWRLDPLLLLGQLSLAGSAVFFAVENIRMRGILTEQAKRDTPIVDDERPVSRRYDYDYRRSSDYEELPSAEARSSRRIRATREPRGRQLDDYGDRRRSYGSDAYERDDRRLDVEDTYRSDYRDPSRPRRRPLPRSRRQPDDQPLDTNRERESGWNVQQRPDDWNVQQPSQDWGDEPPVSSFDEPPLTTDADSADPGSTYRSVGREPKSLSRYRKQRASGSGRYPNRDIAVAGGSGGEYTDYQPVNYPSDEVDQPDDYGDRYR